MAIDSNIKFNYLFAPISFLYGIGVRLRNQFFDWGFLHTEQYPIPVICVGNLSAGGTGKTPHTEYIIDLLSGQYKVAVLSRGYKRKTSGFILAGEQSTSQEIGDEPYQMKHKYPTVLIAVDSDRRRGIRHLLELPEAKRPEVILLDDAFQHRYVTPSLAIVLTDYNRLFYYDKLLPVGRLREPISGGIRRADVVIVTKCEDGLKPIEFRIMEENMKLKAHQQLYFTRIVYSAIQPVFPSLATSRSLADLKKDDDVLLLAGIAYPIQFILEAEKYSDKVTSLIFSDHHFFDKKDIQKIKNAFDKMASPGKLILVTEKDAARLQDNPLIPEEWKQIMYYLPISIDFCVGKEQQFDDVIKKHIVTVRRNSILR